MNFVNLQKNSIQLKKRINSVMQHSPEFLKIVNTARENIKEVTLEEAIEILKKNPAATLVDVREESEWKQEHAKEAQHLGKGIFERDLETRFPDKNQELILYCGGGYRSALSADAARLMGYSKVYSLTGGYKAMVDADWPMEQN